MIYRYIVEDIIEEENNQKQLAVNEGVGVELLKKLGGELLGHLKFAGLFIAANLILLFIINNALSGDRRRGEDIAKHVRKDPTLKKYLSNIFKNLTAFIKGNTPNEYKKFIKFKNNMDLTTDKADYYHDKHGDIIDIELAEIDVEKLFKDTMGKSIEDYLLEKFPNDDPDDVLSLGDYYVEISKIKELDAKLKEIEAWLKDINGNVEKVKNCRINFKLYIDYPAITHTMNNFSILASLHFSNIKNIHFSEEEKEAMEKLK